MVTGLADVQRRFQVGLIRGDLGDVAREVKRTPGLAVHTHAARAMLVEGLADNFAKTLHWLGGEAFTQQAVDYAAISPSGSWTLADYGDDFPDYLRRRLPGDPEVAELAALDWALRSAFGAANPQPATWAQAHDIDWDALRLKLAPGASLLAFATNADAIWAAIPHRPIAPVAAPGLVLVWRDGVEPRFRRLAGQRFGPVCDRCSATALSIGGWLQAWLSAGLVVPRA